ncbi:MAG: SDR family oxidoreductase [Saprospiraceae bacterium]|nr:SDR family oxidoreductase [Saprospiraceae bacterium]MBK7789542.1 SDR family oxidoreductase [Saprospiraceae bacterium]MBK8851188.1 SDR family oxidoreductase [Saprospiraceae bacterium]
MKNKVAFVTGGSQGIGAAVAKSLLDKGLKVAITGRDQAKLDAIQKTLDPQLQLPILCIRADVRNYQELAAAVALVHEKFGTIDTVVANAGVGHFVAIDEMSHEQWNETIDTNLTGVFNTIKACLADLKESRGYFITMASLAGTNFFEKASAYNASKFGLVGFTQAVMLDLRKYGIKVTTIMPGSVSTHFNNNIPSDQDAWKIQPEDLGQMVVDLLSMPERTLPSKIEVRPSFPGK